MIKTGNPELDSSFVEAIAIIADLAEKNITKAADIAGLKVQLAALQQKPTPIDWQPPV